MRLIGAAACSPKTPASRWTRSAACPGPLGRRFAGPEADERANNARRCCDSSRVSPDDDGGAVPGVAVLVAADGREVIGEGTSSKAAIGNEPRGDGGFGYDPHLRPRR